MLSVMPSVEKPPLHEMVRLDGKRALITGAASGIGKQLLLDLLRLERK